MTHGLQRVVRMEGGEAMSDVRLSILMICIFTTFACFAGNGYKVTKGSLLFTIAMNIAGVGLLFALYGLACIVYFVTGC